MGTIPIQTEEIYKIIGCRIRDARRKRLITQESLATQLNLTRTSVTNIEKGRQKLLVHTLIQLSTVLGTTTAELLLGFDQVNNTFADQIPSHLTDSIKSWIITGVKASNRNQSKK